ncbi:MAG: DUF4411 family protein [Rhodobacteraceae bacterium]|nr:DUF4411 family protein [Paracoccaceae bacterium]
MTGYRYLLDANIFIEAKNRHYGFDFCPAFWDWLIAQNRAGTVASIKKVDGELQAGKDELADWAKTRGDGFFLSPDQAVLSAMRTVNDWANNGKKEWYKPAAVKTFLAGADCWLVAHALAHGCTVVTHERPADTVAIIKIPNACDSLNVRCIDPYQMLQNEGARFVLGPGTEVA